MAVLLGLIAAPGLAVGASGQWGRQPVTDVWRAVKPVPPPACAPVLPAADPASPAGGRSEEPRDAPWTFSPNVSPHPETTGQHLWPDIAVAPDGRIGIAWMDDHAAGGYHIFYSESTDEGATWSTPERVDDRTSGAYSKFVSLAYTQAGNPVAVWEDDREGAINVYFARRLGADSWSPNVRVNSAGSPPSGSDYMDASIAAVDDARLFVAWTDWREGPYHQVYMARSDDGGADWGSDTRISDEIGYLPVAGSPCLVADPGSGGQGHEILYCVMNDWRGNVPGGRYPEVYFSRTTDGGDTWSDGVRVNDVTDYYQQVSSNSLVVLDDGTLTCGWYSDDFQVVAFRASISNDGGVTWEASRRIDDPAQGGPSVQPSIAAWGDDVFAGYDVYEGNWNAFFRASSDGGRSWVDPVVRMDDDGTGAATSNTVIAAASADRVHAAWSDTRPGTGTWKIFTTTGRREVTGIAENGERSGAGAVSGAVLICAPNPLPVGEPGRIRLLTAQGDGGVNGPAAVGAQAAASPGSEAVLVISDPTGRIVRRLASRDAGWVWSGFDDSGRQLAAGVYWASVTGRARGRIVLVR